MSRFPFPVPFGWFQVAVAADLAAGDVRAQHAFGRHLVVWRDALGVAHVHDAFCPHLGAHLGHGGVVDGDAIVCPFHGWTFGADGPCRAIPYSQRVNRRARLAPYPVLERNGAVLAWYHPRGDPPRWEVPEVADFAGAAGPVGSTTERRVGDARDEPSWTVTSDDTGVHELRVRTRLVVDTCLQEITENAYDRAHLPHVHGTTGAHEVDVRDEGDHRVWIATTLRYETARGPAVNRVESVSWGPGVGLVHFAGAVDTWILGTTMPITAERTELHFQYLFRSDGSAAALVPAARSYLAEIERQYRQDIAIWEHKTYLERPALTDAESLIPRFRRWFTQFYVDDGADADAPAAPAAR